MGLENPSSQYDGDYMKMEKEFVQIFKHPNSDDPFVAASGIMVAAIRLEKGHDVRKMSD